MTSLTAWLRSVSTTEPVLPSYRRERSALRRAVTKTLFYAIVILMGLFYGLSVAILPPIMLLYVSLPILLIAALALWALPDVGSGPIRLAVFALFAFNTAVILWPDYVAFQIPGFAWISMRRVFSWLLAFALLLCLAMSGNVRRTLAERMRATKPFWIFAGIYFAMQWLTLPLSKNPASSFNGALNNLFIWATPLLAATLVFDREKRVRRWVVLILAAAAVHAVIAPLEAHNRQLLWANHIPGFLTVQDEVLQRILEGAIRDGQYRVTSIYSVSLCLAEFLAVAVPFALQRAFASNHLGRIVFWGLFDLALLGAIVLTNSRLGIVGWLIAHSVFMLLWGWKRWISKARDLIGPAISLAYPVGAALFVFAMFTVPAVRNRTIGGGSTGFSDQSRKEQFAMFWPKLFKNPIGHGVGQSGETLQYRLPGGMVTVDSFFITVGLDFGLLGLISFFGMYIYTIVLMSRVYFRYDSKEAGLAMPIAAAIAVLLAVRLVLSQIDNMPLTFVMFGLAVALYARTVGSPAVKKAGGAPAGRPMLGARAGQQLQPAE